MGDITIRVDVHHFHHQVPAGEDPISILTNKVDFLTDAVQMMLTSQTREETQVTDLEQQIADLQASEDAEHQAVADAIQRVNDKLNALSAANPALADAIANIQADTANLAALAVNAEPPADPVVVPPPADGGNTGDAAPA